MRKDLVVDVVKGDAFRVSFTANEPRTAMRVAERLGSFFIDESVKDREVLAEGTNQFLESQLEDARRRLVENEKRLEEYRRKHDGQLPTQLDANMQGLHNTEMQLQALLDSLSRDQDRRLVLDRIVADSSAGDLVLGSGVAGAADDGGGTAAAQLRTSEQALQTMLLRYRPEHPDVVRLRRTISELRKRAEDEASRQPVSVEAPLSPAERARRNRLEEAKGEIENLNRQITSKSAEEKRLRGVLAEYQRRIEAAPTRESELSELTRDYETLQQGYRSLLVKKQESQMSANLERRQIGEQFKILDPARLPERPSSPDRPRLYLLTILGALATGLGLAVITEYFDRAIRSEEDVRLVVNLLVLATVPNMGDPQPKKTRRRVLAASLAGGAAALATMAVVVWRLWR
jgi:polysaccharide chain length determinant protein (PEP-CTERM system associated)